MRRVVAPSTIFALSRVSFERLVFLFLSVPFLFFFSSFFPLPPNYIEILHFGTHRAADYRVFFLPWQDSADSACDAGDSGIALALLAHGGPLAVQGRARLVVIPVVPSNHWRRPCLLHAWGGAPPAIHPSSIHHPSIDPSIHTKSTTETGTGAGTGTGTSQRPVAPHPHMSCTWFAPAIRTAPNQVIIDPHLCVPRVSSASFQSLAVAAR